MSLVLKSTFDLWPYKRTVLKESAKLLLSVFLLALKHWGSEFLQRKSKKLSFYTVQWPKCIVQANHWKIHRIYISFSIMCGTNIKKVYTTYESLSEIFWNMMYFHTQCCFSSTSQYSACWRQLLPSLKKANESPYNCATSHAANIFCHCFFLTCIGYDVGL